MRLIRKYKAFKFNRIHFEHLSLVDTYCNFHICGFSNRSINSVFLSLTVLVQIVHVFCANDKETIVFDGIFMLEHFIFGLGCSNSEKSVEMKRK